MRIADGLSLGIAASFVVWAGAGFAAASLALAVAVAVGARLVA